MIPAKSYTGVSMATDVAMGRKQQGFIFDKRHSFEMMQQFLIFR